ncbi:MAG: hypothetical protein ACRDRJ_34425 [Streptosporangiaceae bacterium]
MSCLVDWLFCGVDLLSPQLWDGRLLVSSRFGGRVFGVLCALEAELAGELVAEGAVFGFQAGDLGSGGIEPLA